MQAFSQRPMLVPEPVRNRWALSKQGLPYVVKMQKWLKPSTEDTTVMSNPDHWQWIAVAWLRLGTPFMKITTAESPRLAGGDVDDLLITMHVLHDVYSAQRKSRVSPCAAATWADQDWVKWVTSHLQTLPTKIDDDFSSCIPSLVVEGSLHVITSWWAFIRGHICVYTCIVLKCSKCVVDVYTCYSRSEDSLIES